MKNSKLRKQLEDLESENRRLLLAREVSLSPAEITKTARNLGFLEVNATAALPIPVSNKSVSPAPPKAAAEKSPKFEASQASLTMTAYQRPVKTMLSETPSKSASPEKQTKKPETAKQKTIKPEITAVAKLR